MMQRRTIFGIILILITSSLMDIIIKQLLGYSPIWVPYTKLLILIGSTITCLFFKEIKQFLNFTFILVAIIIVEIFTDFISSTIVWNSIFSENSFAHHFGSGILQKFIQVLLVIAVLLFRLKSRNEAYLTKGDLSIKAEKISWLGINDKEISWWKLSVISALLISLGTFLLTMVTVTGFALPNGVNNLVRFLHMIIFFALVNSFCEGVLYRSTIIGTLKDVLPKNQVIIIAAIFFGIAHYYGAPSGVIGVVMSGLLGWYMSRSMYETKGFASSWIIHFMQDVVIFSSIYLFGGYI